MRKLILTLAFLCGVAAAAQTTTTPNVGLQLPAYGSTNWNIPLQFNFNRIDSIFGGNTLIPGLKVTNLTVTNLIFPGGAGFLTPGSYGQPNGTAQLNSSSVLSNLFLTPCGASGSGHSAGIVPDPGPSAGTTRVLYENCTWGAIATAITAAQIQQQSLIYAADTGTANVYAVSQSPSPTLGAGSVVIFKALHANTGASTLTVNGGSAIALKKASPSGLVALVANDIVAGQVVTAVDDGTQFQANVGASAAVTASAVTAAIQANTNCNIDATYYWNPSTGSCTQPSGGTPTLLQPQNGGTGVIAGTPLEYWYAALHNCSTQVVDINVHGDSRAIADTTVTTVTTGISVTFAQRWTNRMMRTLQTRCGSHGTGVVPFRYGVSPNGNGFNLDYYTQTGTYTTTNTTVGPFFGSDSMTVDATSNGFTVTFLPGMPIDHIRAYCVSGAALNPWTINIDGSAVGTCGVSSGSRAAALGTSSAVTLATHTVTMVCPTQPCAAYGMEGVAGTTGVAINNFSVGSAPAEIFAGTPSTQYAYENLIPDPIALDVIYMIANEPGQGVPTSTFQTTLNSMVSHDRGLTYPASVLIVAPLLDNLSGQAPYYPILLATANAQNTSYVDIRDRWGTSIAPAFLFGPDGIHEDNTGNGEVLSSVYRAMTDVDVAALPIVPPAPSWADILAGTVTTKAIFPGGLLFNAGVNAQVGTSYTIVAGDENRVTTYSNALAVAVTLPAATTAGFTAGAYFTEVNQGVGTVTITPTTSTINGASSLVLATGQSARLTSDGANYAAELGAGAGGVSGVSPIVVTGSAVSCPTCSTGSGTNVEVNGGSALGTANLNATTPAAAGGHVNVTWQVSGNNVSAQVPSASGLVLLESHTASASTELDFTAWSDPTDYDNYVIEIEDMVLSTALTPQFQFSTNGGSTWDTATSYGWHEWVDYQTTGASASSGSGATATSMPLSDSTITTSSGSAMFFTVKLYSPGGAHYKVIIAEGTDYGAVAGFAIHRVMTCMYFNVTAVNAFRLKASTGNFTSGTVRVYGVANH